MDDVSRRYKSWDGCDITAIVQGEVLETPHEINYKITRDTPGEEHYPGKKFVVTPKPFSRGKRGIAGTLVALMLDKGMLEEE